MKSQPLEPVISFSTFELLCATIQTETSPVRIYVVYRPPSSSFPRFLEEMTEFLEHCLSKQSPFVILGDFNIDVDDKTKLHSKQFIQLLDALNIHQHVKDPTHTAGHVLDLIITPEKSPLNIGSVHSSDLISDHFAVCGKFSITHPSIKDKTVNCRDFRKFTIEQFRQDRAKSSVVTSPASSLEDSTNQYNCDLSNILDKHAPTKSRKLRHRTNNGWYNETIHGQKQRKRALQRKYQQSRDPKDLSELIRERDSLKTNIASTKTEFYKSKIHEVEHDKSALFKQVNMLLHKNTNQALPDKQSPKEFCDNHNSFFVSKIDKI